MSVKSKGRFVASCSAEIVECVRSDDYTDFKKKVEIVLMFVVSKVFKRVET